MSKWDLRNPRNKQFSQAVAEMVGEYFAEKGLVTHGDNYVFVEMKNGMLSAYYDGATSQVVVYHCAEFTNPKIVFTADVADPTFLDRLWEVVKDF